MFRQARFLTSATGPEGYPVHRRTEVALAGRSNVGKSSLINALTGKKGLAKVAKRPGRTQTLNFYALTDSLCLVDLPGYGFAEVPHRVRAGWARMIEGYLTGRDQLKAILLLVDGRHGPTGDDLEMWEWIKASGRSGLAVATKWDKVKKSLRVKRMKEMEAALAAPVLPFSAVTSEGKQGLMSFLLSLV
ncbi:MAG: ribosome biogenesis GTP-binding protein YihA/YsxC [Clostridia bacterium]|nr:YihA family ribosome biogenesis GTP-binding protein [Bacillota bacterium]MBO2521045.1 YihA family ribosome biogenesis GTP-binding protein [Bacillota bacterium]